MLLSDFYTDSSQGFAGSSAPSWYHGHPREIGHPLSENLDPSTAVRLSQSGTLLEYSGSRKNWQCDHCGKTFTNGRNKRFHEEAVHGNANYACVCGKVYRYPRNLARHKVHCSLASQMKAIPDKG